MYFETAIISGIQFEGTTIKSKSRNKIMNEKEFASIIREQSSIRSNDIYAYEKEERLSTAFGYLMRKVYLWMTLALAITGFSAYLVAESGLVYTLFSNQIMIWVLIIAELGLVFGLSGAINKLSLTTATLMFVVYSVINGLTLSTIFVIYEPSVIAKVFFITAGAFAGLAFVGYTTKKDLSVMGKFLFMALIGLIIATLVNIFLKSSGLDLILSYGGVLIFAGLTAWDSQKIKEMCMSFEYADASAQKMALLGSLTLYLDFINLFLYLLRIFGRRD